MERSRIAKQELASVAGNSCHRIRGCDTVDHVDGHAKVLFQRVCKLDLEGIVQEAAVRPLSDRPRNNTWFKIRNREYSQMAGREELLGFEGVSNAGAHRRNPSNARDLGLEW